MDNITQAQQTAARAVAMDQENTTASAAEAVTLYHAAARLLNTATQHARMCIDNPLAASLNLQQITAYENQALQYSQRAEVLQNSLVQQQQQLQLQQQQQQQRQLEEERAREEQQKSLQQNTQPLQNPLAKSLEQQQDEFHKRIEEEHQEQLKRRSTMQNEVELSNIGNQPPQQTSSYYPDLFPELQMENEEALVPKGYVVCYSDYGVPYLALIPEGVSQETAQQRADAGEHFTIANTLKKMGEKEEEEEERLPFFANNKKIAKYYGASIVLYFRFMIFLIHTNLVVVVLAMANWIPHLIIDYKRDAGFEGTYGNVTREVTSSTVRKQMYLASYTEHSMFPWLITTILLAVFSVAIVFWYIFDVNRFFKKHKLSDCEGKFKVTDAIPGNQQFSTFEKVIRYFIGYFIFALLLFISGGITFGITILQINLGNSKLGSVLIAIVIVIIGIIWPKIAMKINQMEKHSTWNSFRRHLLFKYLTFKELNVCAMYISKYIVLNKAASTFKLDWDVPKFWWDSTPTAQEISFQALERQCGLVDMGDQILILMLVELTLCNCSELFFTPVYNFLTKTMCCKPVTNEDKLGNFEIAEEYLELIYRQFILYLSTPYFPVVSLICTVVNVVEIFVDRYRLFKKSRKPPVIHGSMKSVIALYLSISAILAFLLFPRGILFILLGTVTKDICPNSIYDHPMYGKTTPNPSLEL